MTIRLKRPCYIVEAFIRWNRFPPGWRLEGQDEEDNATREDIHRHHRVAQDHSPAWPTQHYVSFQEHLCYVACVLHLRGNQRPHHHLTRCGTSKSRHVNLRCRPSRNVTLRRPVVVLPPM